MGKDQLYNHKQDGQNILKYLVTTASKLILAEKCSLCWHVKCYDGVTVTYFPATFTEKQRNCVNFAHY